MDTPISAHLVVFLSTLVVSRTSCLATSEQGSNTQRSIYYVDRREQGRYSPFHRGSVQQEECDCHRCIRRPTCRRSRVASWNASRYRRVQTIHRHVPDGF